MRNVNLEENELTITAIFQQRTKEETIQTLKEAMDVLEQEEDERSFCLLMSCIRLSERERQTVLWMRAIC